MKQKNDMLNRLISFTHDLRYEDLPKCVVHETKRRVIDALGCSLGSLSDERVMKLRRELRKENCGVSARGFVIGMGERLSLDYAAFLNSAMIRWLDYNDTYLALEPAHPSDNLGLIFAICGKKQISGKDFITATAVAYDIQCRLCEAASLRKHGWDHVNYLLFSSTLAGAKLLGFDQRQMYDAVAFSLNSNIAMRQARVGTVGEQKNMAAADACRAAAWALMKVKAGFKGPEDIVFGTYGFVRQVSKGFRSSAFKGLGQEFLIQDTYLKKYPVEYHAQTAVEHALAFRSSLRGSPRASDISVVLLKSYEAALSIIGGQEKYRPKTKESADHSLYYAFAVALLKGRFTLKEYCPELISNSDVLAVADKITLTEYKPFTDLYRNADRTKRAFPSYALLLMKNGRVFEDFRNYPKGHPKNPLTDEEVTAKFLEMTKGVCSYPDNLIDHLWHLENIPAPFSDMKLLLDVIKTHGENGWRL